METEQIDKLADLMERHGLTRVRLEEGDGSAVELECQPAPAVVMPAPTPGNAGAQPPAPDPDDGTTAVTAPMVGVFYAAPSPGAEPFVRAGSKVHKGDTLCVIEAMKLMNEVTAERDGEVAEVCTTDGELVEFGRCLMRIR